MNIMIEEIKIKLSALEYEIDMLDINEKKLTGVDVILKEVKELVEKLTAPIVVFSEADLKVKLEEQLEDTRQWLIGEDFEGLAERL